MKVVVSLPNGTEIAKGKLTVNTSVTPITVTFKPNGGTEVNCTVTTWSTSSNGPVDFSFTVSNAANGDFPLGPNNTAFTYVFTGTENSNGTYPAGSVTWPGTSLLKDTGGDSPTWQSEADEDEPIQLSTAAGYPSN